MRVLVRLSLYFVLMTVVLAVTNEAQKEVINHNTRSTRLRHLRHLEGRRSPSVAEPFRSSSSSRNSQNTVSIGDGSRLTVGDNHKPLFVNCSLYRPEVPEEQTEKAFVIQVQAVDKDPPDAGGTVTYSFVLSKSDQKKFTIDPHAGYIRTNHMFDRDEPNREKEVYLTVRATDNGLPQLDDVCTFKVIITDVNDNPPSFDKASYMESVPQDLPVGNEVMRVSASDIDDGNNSLVYYSLDDSSNYFHIDQTTGIIFLDKAIDKDPGQMFRLNVTATDQGEGHNSAKIVLDIRVVESHKKPPTFTDDGYDQIPKRLLENRTDFQDPIIILNAKSNIQDEPELQFVLVTGRTEQTNKLNTFAMQSDGNRALIKQAKLLDFETIQDYVLTVRVQNKYSLAAERHIQIQIEDINDNIPYFSGVLSGQVSENEPPGTPVMQVRAFDGDATSQHNTVTYELGDNLDLFHIDPNTGNITTQKQFDREEKDYYNVKVYATDNSPSPMNNGAPNRGEQVFSIQIADKNDNPPRFTQRVYVAESIGEDANLNFLVTEVKALDNDTDASPVKYAIIEGNEDDTFSIDNSTGQIRVKNNTNLDYERVTSYSLKVLAFDGKFEDTTKVEIKIENVNDNPPKFLPHNNNITIEEEKLSEGCIVELKAYDPDIQDAEADQKIVYFVVDEAQKKDLTINKTGCLSLIRPLDRDPPKGFPTVQVFVGAKDEDGNSPTSLQETTEIVITLTDINDNAPFLDMPHPVVWKENQLPGKITELQAKDNDSDENGPPFSFMISPSASEDITKKFGVNKTNLLAKVQFDRETQKVYYIPIQITDSGIPPQTGTSTLTVIIGDENDNPMQPGSSSIFVYNYKGEAPDTEIGRVYVDDPDDWDLPDKQFTWKYDEHDYFSLNRDTGMVTMRQGTTNGSFLLEFTVTEEGELIQHHQVEATVNVTVKEIPEEAVDKSGSVRFSGITAEEFVAPVNGGPSKYQILSEHIASMLNISVGNVDVFTVLHSPRRNSSRNLLDVRFSAHGSPYYYPEKLNRLAMQHQDAIERDIGAPILMINIDECLLENDLCNSKSCTNFLNKQASPYVVNTNTTSFVGVNAVVDPLCTCSSKDPLICLNGGTLVGNMCECMDGFEGPQCEILGISFRGDGWALYPPLQACEESHLSLDLQTHKDSGLVFYVGPMRNNNQLNVQDFMSLELRDGYPVLLVDYGTGTVDSIVKETLPLSDGRIHHIEIIWSITSIELKVDYCKTSLCFMVRPPEGANKFLNVNGPLQVGGTVMNLKDLSHDMKWNHTPTDRKFTGCIRNLTFNSKTYNLGTPGDSENALIDCNKAIATAVSFGIDTNFLVAILVCVAILLILLLAVVVHRRKTDDMYKDMDDIRENIITYEDEGGGEIDAGFDMNVLRMYDSDGQPMLSKPIMKDHLQTGADDVPDICGFLDGKKKICDNDPETNPFDDVRHYAYEGDGNTTGSLSSLASGTDEGDLNFDYLSNFGPRFRKLADMYGEDPSDDDDNFNNPASESWC